MTTSFSPTAVNPNAVIFKITASDVEWMMNSLGYDFRKMDPHVWAKARKAVETTMGGVWADACAEAITKAITDEQE
jgi:hypothetical protein